MFKYIGKKVAILVGMILLISFIIFLALNNTGVDPVLFTLDVTTIDADAIEQARAAHGLDDPLIIRYFRWWTGIFQGDFGYSIAQGYPIKYILISKWPASLEIAILSLILSSFLGIGIGILSAYYQNSLIDYIGRSFSVIGNSVPSYFFALVLIMLFSIKLGWLPVSGRIPIGAVTFWDRVPNLVLPVLAMSIPMCGDLTRHTRNTMLEVSNQEFVKMARSKGIPEWRVYIKHIFRNSLQPVITVLLFRLGILVGGSVAIETIFSWPGVGPILTDAITASDYPVVMLSALSTSIVMLLISFLIDVFTALLDPRVRLKV